ncbi:uroporphyrinogen-III synthase [Rubrivivax rivuli]|uniref:Uroporphyrinogen-III synthase n=1 Tax=Rubrivivax rivuli TaxID=1862385 RepID=A0A437RD72_9BURK|nr:uroporphyrinogen-III synthase [Rubrivivax rivuli]
MHCIVTRPAAQAADWVAALHALGAAASALPLIDIAPPTDPTPVRAAWERLPSRALVMFVSANAVQHFFALAPAGAGWPAGVRAGCTGPGTAAALQAAGVPAAAVVQPAPGAGLDSEGLWAQLEAEPWAGRQVLVVRGEEGRDWLADTLRERGADVAFVAAYRRCPPVLDAAGQALLARAQAEPAAHGWVFSSSEAVAHLRALVPAARWQGACALASHPRIAQAAREAGFGRVELLPAPTPAAVTAWAQRCAPIQSASQ